MSTRSAKLAEYRRKRDFSRTREPKGGTRKRPPRLAYVIQKHAASSLHYDLRLELDGVMKSWAVPKGSWVLVRTKGRGERSRQGQWLLIKHRDEAADPDTDPTEAYQTSARTGRTMDGIAEGQPKRSSR